MLKRKIDNYIRKYYETTRNALLITGARQTGKTSSVREFGKSFKSFIEINFIDNPSAAGIFSGAKVCRGNPVADNKWRQEHQLRFDI